MKRRYMLLAGVLAALLVPVGIMAQEEQEQETFEIPFKVHTLKNGLTLIYHHDPKAPLVAVNIWYHVGSKNEPEGKSGFAHLFEHLMFNGSENYNDDYFKVLNPLGATTINGTTNFDRTNYFQTVPKTALDTVLWLESDRMGHLLGAIDLEKLDEQREVVKNEKRQGDNQPYGTVQYKIFENVFPKGHPYHHSVIGSMDDLNAASVEDVHGWFKKYYGPNNAVVAIAGDIDFETAKQKVEHYFGDIPPGPPLERMEAWVPRWEDDRRFTMQDRVPLPQLAMVWTMPEWGTLDADEMALVSDLLSSGKSSRLYKRLVYDDNTCLFVASISFPLEIAGLFGVIAIPKPGVSLETVEATVREELDRFLKEGPTDEELTRVRTQRIAGFLRGAETIGGFGGKSDILATNYVYGGDPAYFQNTLENYRSATVESLRETANDWLGSGAFVLTVTPYPRSLAAAEDGADRGEMPQPGDAPEANFPEMKEATLDNGLKVIVVERDTVPVVNAQLVFDAGYAADAGQKPGTGNLALTMLIEGTDNMDALQISDKLQLLGMNFGTGGNLDQSTISMNSLKSNLEESMALFADLVIRPTFPNERLTQIKGQMMGAIQQQQATPSGIAQTVMPKLLYGEDHPYGMPHSGTGTVQSVQFTSVDDLKTFHSTWIRPNNATMIVVGDTSLEDIVPLIEEHFGEWEGADIPSKGLSKVEKPSGSKIYIVDRPDAEQSLIVAATLTIPETDPMDTPLEVMERILGGDFNARINMNLREDKGWTYGARTSITSAVGQRPFYVNAPVQSDKTAEGMVEIMKELRGMRGEVPATAEELERVRKGMTLTLNGQLETSSSVAGGIAQLLRYDYPMDYFDSYVEKINNVTLEDVEAAAKMAIDPDNMIWIVIGDSAKIEESIKGLNYGEIIHINAQGNVIDR